MRVEALDSALHVRFNQPMKFYSTMPPGYGEATDVLIVEVDEEFKVDNIEDAQAEAAASHGYPSALVFFTAASVADYIHYRGSYVEILATVGPRPPVCPGGGGVRHEPLRSLGTINLVVESLAPLRDAGALDLLRTVAEAKAAAAADSLLRCYGAPPWRSVGTVTDAIAVFYRDSGGGYVTAGHSTSIGGEAGLLVYRAVLSASRPDAKELLKRALGVGFDEILSLYRDIYSASPHPRLSVDEAVRLAARLAEAWLRDPNVALILIAARELDIHASTGSVPGLDPGEYRSDSPGIVADEVLGMALADYLAGTRGVFAMYWVERLKKKGLLSEGDVFADDIVSALLGALVARVLEEVGAR